MSKEAAELLQDAVAEDNYEDLLDNLDSLDIQDDIAADDYSDLLNEEDSDGEEEYIYIPELLGALSELA